MDELHMRIKDLLYRWNYMTPLDLLGCIRNDGTYSISEIQDAVQYLVTGCDLVQTKRGIILYSHARYPN